MLITRNPIAYLDSFDALDLSVIFSGMDAAAAAYITALTAAGVTPNAATQTAINNFYVSLKNAALYDKLYAFYLVIGGTAATHAINGKAPGTNNITWNGTLTHNANGVTGDGSTGYGNLGFAPNAVITSGVGGLGYYRRTSANTLTTDMGCIAFAGSVAFNIYQFGTTKTVAIIGTTTVDKTLEATSQGFVSASRATGGAAINLYLNGASIASGSPAVGAAPSQQLYVLARNNAGSAELFTSANYTFFYVDNGGLTSGNMLDFYTALQALQTALSRQV